MGYERLAVNHRNLHLDNMLLRKNIPMLGLAILGQIRTGI